MALLMLILLHLRCLLIIWSVSSGCRRRNGDSILSVKCIVMSLFKAED